MTTVCVTDWIMLPALSSWQRLCHTIFFQRGNSFFLCLTGHRKEQQMNPASLPVMVFWFQFPISSLSQFDKVTSRCHLQYPTPFTQAPWNAIINMKYCPDRLEPLPARKTSMFTVQKSSPCPRCQPLSVFSGKKKKKNLQQGLLIPRLFVVLLQFSKTRLSPSLLTIWTSRWNDISKEIFILLNKPPNPFK